MPSALYIFWILHQTTTDCPFSLALLRCISFESYIKPQRTGRDCRRCGSCISFESYIKPQRTYRSLIGMGVVYLLNPTSNHNQVTTLGLSWALYIFWILHQTTTVSIEAINQYRCISFESYIKPQPLREPCAQEPVVYLLNPTSNHNAKPTWGGGGARRVVYLLNPTSNHNCAPFTAEARRVVYLLNPTSNHNPRDTRSRSSTLYIFWILHQTTTVGDIVEVVGCCISFESYIKPQRSWITSFLSIVVYLLNPTSNHN